jgi:hypothetical protein
VALGVAGRDQATHRVADEHDRQAGVLAAGTLDEQVQVVDDRVEVGDQGALALRAPVPEWSSPYTAAPPSPTAAATWS